MNPASVIPLILRIGVSMCFIGHGAFGLLQKRDWLPFFNAFGIGPDWAMNLMPVIGSVDIAVGMAALFLPIRALFLYGAVWCLFTAALRPMTAQSAGEVIERAGNYGVPLAMLALTAGQRWFARADAPHDGGTGFARVARVCQWTTALLLVGHGWLALEGKPLLMGHLTLVGGQSWLQTFGLFELSLAAAAILFPSRTLFAGIVAWKIATESLFVFSGAPVWEFIERGGSFAAPLAAALLSRVSIAVPATKRAQAVSAAVLVVLFAPKVLAQTPASPSPAPASLSPAILGELHQGGLIVACRHSITSHAQEDRQPVNFDDPSTQRILSPEGEAQAADLGKRFASLKIPFGAVLASPFQRTRRTAELMAGKVQIDDALSSMTKGKDAELKALMTGPVASGGNRLVVTHQGLIYRTFTTIQHGSIAEGDCLVIRPGGDILATIKPEGWK
jgi:phosphohistidine phosphatase SixA